MRNPLMLAPGVVRLRPDDHFTILSESDASRAGSSPWPIAAVSRRWSSPTRSPA
ncbi:hypothetical protein [Sphingobium sp. Z007]|uniref:hypothetical protein n=1 Tax=Sphingobium sp. Z007 TaxID=627495 RepID=UPI0015958648|nr:hypothetical protein [Sphingobium sp. Z007]